MKTLRPFHLAIPVQNLSRCREFYRDILECPEGRSDSKWVDFNLFGHQLVIHEVKGKNVDQDLNPVDGKHVPVPHFGVILSMNDWKNLAERLRQKSVTFIIEPYIRFEGEPGEQATMFFHDPDGNALEFKAFNNLENLFEK